MGNVSRPLLGLLVAVVAFFALWLVALKPSSSSTAGGSPSQALGRYQSAINRAKGVQAVVNHAAVAAGGKPGVSAQSTPATTTPAHARATTTATTVHGSATTSKAHGASTPKGAVSPKQRLEMVEQALAAHKVLAALFYNPAASDDQAVKQELTSIPTHSGKVVKLTVPLNELSSYTVITNQVPVASSPTLVVIGRGGQASTIVGFADTFEIAQRIAGAL